MSLDCWYCGREFDDFYPLAKHVQRVHVKGLFDEGERTPMNKSQKWPEPNGENQDFNPWLTVEHLGKSGKGVMTIIGNPRESQSQFGEGVIVDVKIGSDAYSWTVKFTSGNYSRLFKKMGTPDKWKGKVNVEVKEYMGKEYVAVV